MYLRKKLKNNRKKKMMIIAKTSIELQRGTYHGYCTKPTRIFSRTPYDGIVASGWTIVTRKSVPLLENLSFYKENFHSSSLEEYSLYKYLASLLHEIVLC